MAKNIELSVRRSSRIAHVAYDVGVEGERHAVPLEEVLPTARTLLKSRFCDGDSIVYCDILFVDIDEAVRAVDIARAGWA